MENNGWWMTPCYGNGKLPADLCSEHWHGVNSFSIQVGDALVLFTLGGGSIFQFFFSCPSCCVFLGGNKCFGLFPCFFCQHRRFPALEGKLLVDDRPFFLEAPLRIAGGRVGSVIFFLRMS